jgi:integrase
VGRKPKDQRSRGQITERGDRKYLVRVYIGRDAYGKRDYKSAVVNGTISQAQAKLTAMLGDVDTEDFIPQAKKLFGDFIDSWLVNTAPMRVTVGTAKGYGACLARVKDTLGSTRLDRVSPQAIQQMYKDMADDDMSTTYIALTHTLTKMVLEQAVAWRLIKRNPAKGATIPVGEEKSDEDKANMAFTKEEADLFLEAAKKTPRYAMWLTFLATGLRPQELFALKWSDLETKMVRVQKADGWTEVPTSFLKVQRAMKSVGAGKYTVGVPKTKKGRRQVSIPSTLVDALNAHRLAQVKLIMAGGPDFERNDLIFPTAQGRHLSHKNVRRSFHALCKVAKVKKIKLYGLRHTHATILLGAGWHLKIVSERLGHSSIMLTGDTYSHVQPVMEHETALMIEQLLPKAIKA